MSYASSNSRPHDAEHRRNLRRRFRGDENPEPQGPMDDAAPNKTRAELRSVCDGHNIIAQHGHETKTVDTLEKGPQLHCRARVECSKCGELIWSSWSPCHSPTGDGEECWQAIKKILASIKTRRIRKP